MPSVNYRNFMELCEDCKDLNLTIEQHLRSLTNNGFDVYIKGEKVLEGLQ
jgi:hypothetical protein